jgi:hypothetical protein
MWSVWKIHYTGGRMIHFCTVARDHCLGWDLIGISRSNVSCILHVILSIIWFQILVSWGGVRLSPFGKSATKWPIVPAPDDRWWMWSSRWNEKWEGKPKYSEKNCPSSTLSTTNPTWPVLGSKPGRSDRKPATNSLSYGMALSDFSYWGPVSLYENLIRALVRKTTAQNEKSIMLYKTDFKLYYKSTQLQSLQGYPMFNPNPVVLCYGIRDADMSHTNHERKETYFLRVMSIL